MKAGGKEDLKKIENPKWWGGDLKDIYTDRRKKKVDYLEVSDVEDSDVDEEEEQEKRKTKKKGSNAPKKNLSHESRVSSISEDDSVIKEESLPKKKHIEKKPLKQESIMEKKRKNASQPTKSIAVQIFKGKRKEDSSDEDTEDIATKTENKGTESLSKGGKKRKSETLSASEESLLVKSAKKKSLSSLAKTAREKMVTSDSEPEIVKKDLIKIEDDSEEKSNALADHDVLSNQIREKLLSNKSEKVKCQYYQYNRSFHLFIFAGAVRELQQEFEEQHHPAIPPAPLHSHPGTQVGEEEYFLQLIKSCQPRR